MDRPLRAVDQWQQSIDQEIAKLDEAGLRRFRRTLTPLKRGLLKADFRTLVNLSGNDYLGLSYHPQVLAAAHAALEDSVGSRASALISGRSPWHEQLERTIAAFEGCEDALIFPTGAAANVGVLTAVMRDSDTVYCDRLNHASLIDGCRQSGATLRIYRHLELERLERELQKPVAGGRRWIVTDSVFSMDGDIAPLPDLCDLAEAYDALLVVDEAHGTGVYGHSGRGVCEHFHVENRVALRIGTLSKALGAMGGFVVGSHSLCEFLLNKARTQIYSTSLPPAVCAAAAAAIGIIESEPERRQRLWHHVRQINSQLRQANLIPDGQFASPIIPIAMRNPENVMKAAQAIEEAGFLVGAIRPPTVPEGTSRLRLSVHSELTENERDQAIEVITQVVTVVKMMAGRAT